MSKKADLAKNTLIIAAGRFSVQLVSFVLLPVYTFFLTPEQYGLVDLIITYVTLMVPIVLLQLDRGAFRFLIDTRGDARATASIIAGAFRVVSLVLVAALAIYAIVAIYFGVPYYLLIAAMVVSTAVMNLLLQIARGLGHNLEFAKASFASAIVLFVSALLLVVVAGVGVPGVLVAMAIAHTIGALYLIYRLRMFNWLKSERGVVDYSGKMVRYSLPLIPSNISWWAISVADRTIITIIIGIAANGIYAVANKYASIFSAVYAVFDMSWTESASLHINSKDKDRFFSEVHNTTLRVFGSLALLMVAGMPIVFNLLVGAEFREAYNYFPILVVAAFSGAIVAQYSTIYIAKKMTGKVFVTSMSAAAINIVLNILFIGKYGLYAAALATVVAYVAMGLFRAYDTKKYVNIKYEKSLVLGVAALGVMASALYYLNSPLLNIVNLLIVALAAYFLNRKLINAFAAKVKTRLEKS